MSYLGGRTQQVQIESKVSPALDCGDHAVPQGSVLGGLLHIINCNDFPACHDEGEAVVYVDDDSDIVHAAEPAELHRLIQQEATNSADWLSDNRLCVAGEKSKLLIIGTNKLKKQKLREKLKIEVDGKEIVESDSEKVLGVVINNQLSWKNHLHGDDDHEGLIPQLSKRLGILRKLSNKMSKERLKQFTAGIFYSKLNYCLPVYGNVFGLEKYKEVNSRYLSFTTRDNNKLQILQNGVNRLLLGADKYTSTSELLKRTHSLSIQQMIAFQTIVMTYKILKTKKPSYIASKFQDKSSQRHLRSAKCLYQPNQSLSITKEGFVSRGLTLMNMLDISLQAEPKLEKFKTKLEEWVKRNIATKPSSKYPDLGRRGEPQAARAQQHPGDLPQVPVAAVPPPNLITNYFQQLRR